MRSGARQDKGPDPALTARTYAVALPTKGESLSHPFCRGRPSLRCPSVEKTALVIEYWLFINDYVFKAATAFGSITQRHEADWEVIVVGFSARSADGGTATYKPLWAAFSEHCGGSWLPWSAVTRHGTHPVAWVALGSHANYPSGRGRSPNWASCVKISWLDRLVDVLSFSASVVEKLPESGAPLTPLSVVDDGRARPYLQRLEPLGPGETIGRFGWHTAARERTEERTPSAGQEAPDRVPDRAPKMGSGS